MSVQIVQTEQKTTGQGWQVSRRAFLAQTSALLVAMGIPAKRANALAGQLYQSREQGLASKGYVDEVIMALGEKVSGKIDPSGAASVQLLVKKLYEDAGLSATDAKVALDAYFAGAAANKTAGELGGETVADVLGRVIAPDVMRSIEGGLQTAMAKLSASGTVSAELDALLSGALNTASLVGDTQPGDVLHVFNDAESALMGKMLAPLHASRKRIEASVPNGSVSVDLEDSAEKLHNEVLNVLVANWLEVQYDEADFAEARALAQAILAKSDLSLPASEKAGSVLLGLSGQSEEIVRTSLAKLRNLVNDPSALHGTLEKDLAESQAELDEVLARLDVLSQELTGQPIQFAENVPGTRYVLADLNGVNDKVAQEMVDELNRLNERAGELSVKVVETQFQMEDLNVQGSDGQAVEAKMLMLEHQVARAAEVLEKIAAALQSSEAVVAKASLDEAKTAVEIAIEEAFRTVEMNKELARTDINPVDWAVQKSAAAQLLVQSAQMNTALRQGLQLNAGGSAMTETFKMLGLWKQNMPVDSLEDLCEAQLAARTDKALREAGAFAADVKARFQAGYAALGHDQLAQSVSNIVAAALAQANPKLDAPLASLGFGANATVGEIAAAVKADMPGTLELQGVQESAFVAASSTLFAQAILDAAKDSPALAAVFADSDVTTIAGANVHVLAFKVLGAVAEQPVTEAITNYFGTMIAGAFGEGPVSLAAYSDVAPETVNTIVAKAQARQSIVASAKEPMAESGHGLVGLLLPNLLSGFSTLSRDIIVRQAKTTLNIDIH